MKSDEGFSHWLIGNIASNLRTTLLTPKNKYRCFFRSPKHANNSVLMSKYIWMCVCIFVLLIKFIASFPAESSSLYILCSLLALSSQHCKSLCACKKGWNDLKHKWYSNKHWHPFIEALVQNIRKDNNNPGLNSNQNTQFNEVVCKWWRIGVFSPSEFLKQWPNYDLKFQAVKRLGNIFL